MFLSLETAVGLAVVIWQLLQGRWSSQIHVPCDSGFTSGEAAGYNSHSIEEGNLELSAASALPLPLLYGGVTKNHKPEEHLSCSSPVFLASYLLTAEVGSPAAADCLLTSFLVPAVGVNVGSPFESSSQELPSCCKELGS